jgi:REP element-mobilizing transposase RayT
MEHVDEVIAFQATSGTYGFWLPNDPRGSLSKEVRAANLRRFGPATTLDHAESTARTEHSAAKRAAAKRALSRPEVFFTPPQIESVAAGFGKQTTKSGYRVFACAILEQHVHMVIGCHRYPIEQVVRQLRQAATLQLIADNLHPFVNQRLPSGYLPSVWEQDFWKTFLYTYDDVINEIGYVEENPLKEKKSAQKWPFVIALQ